MGSPPWGSRLHPRSPSHTKQSSHRWSRPRRRPTRPPRRSAQNWLSVRASNSPSPSKPWATPTTTRWWKEASSTRLANAPGLSWPLVAGRDMSRWADVALACTSYAMAAPWRIPGAAIVWDLAPFDRRLRTPRGSLLERVTLPIAVRRCGALIAISETTRAELGRRFPRPSRGPPLRRRRRIPASRRGPSPATPPCWSATVCSARTSW